MKTVEQYLASLKSRTVRLFVRGQLVTDPIEHPLVAPSVRTVAETYRLAGEPEHRELFTAHSRFIGAPVNRFTHIFEQPEDLTKKVMMQRVVGRFTGTCFQRCVGMDALNALYTTLFGSAYHERFVEFLKYVQREDLVLCGAMTDPKGDRRKGPLEQPDQYLRVVRRTKDSLVVRGAKMHQTGVVNSHWIVAMPGRTLTADERDFAVAFAVPVDAKGITMVYGRQPSDDRRMGCDIDQGNARYGGQEAVVLFDDVEVPIDHVFMAGDSEMAAPLVDTFAGYHRQSYGGCKPGNGDVLIGASALLAKLAGVDRAPHVRDKLVEMTQLNETMHAGGLACSSKCTKTPAGTYMVDPLLANVTKQNVTRMPYEMARLAEDIAGGLLVTMPSAEDFDHPEIGPQLRKYVDAERQRVLRLVESMTIGQVAVAFRTESMHGAGSPQAQRMRIEQQADYEGKIADAKRIAGVRTDH
jgi:4-hydroxybutyryl-CoA dehydratase/vinylacetyl-CoA-Delta-isomerase